MKKDLEIIRKYIFIDTWIKMFSYVDIHLLAITSYMFLCRFIVS